MAIQKEFEDFVQAKNREATEKPRVDWEKRKAVWLEQVNNLYDRISTLLSGYIDNGAISLARIPVEVTEERLGTYLVDELRIGIGEKTLRLTPIGAVILGAYGRVDLIGSRGRIRMVLVDPGAGAPRVEIKVLKPGERLPEVKPVDLNALEWRLASDPPGVKIRDLTRESLFEAILDVADE